MLSNPRTLKIGQPLYTTHNGTVEAGKIEKVSASHVNLRIPGRRRVERIKLYAPCLFVRRPDAVKHKRKFDRKWKLMTPANS